MADACLAPWATEGLSPLDRLLFLLTKISEILLWLHSSAEIFRSLGVPMTCGCVKPPCRAPCSAWLHHSGQHAARVLPRWHFETFLTVRSNEGHWKEALGCLRCSPLPGYLKVGR